MKKLLLTASLAVIGLQGMQATSSSTATTQMSLRQQLLQQELADATIRGTVEDIKRSITAGANINALDKYGYTILHFACWGKRAANIQYVLSIINPSLINQIYSARRQTALDCAINFHCNQPIIDLLRSRGAKTYAELPSTAQPQIAPKTGQAIVSGAAQRMQPSVSTTATTTSTTMPQQQPVPKQTIISQPQATVNSAAVVAQLQQQVQQLQQRLIAAQRRPIYITQSTQTNAVSDIALTTATQSPASPTKVACPGCGNLFKYLKMHKCKVSGAKRTHDATIQPLPTTQTTATQDDIQQQVKRQKPILNLEGIYSDSEDVDINPNMK